MIHSTVLNASPGEIVYFKAYFLEKGVIVECDISGVD